MKNTCHPFLFLLVLLTLFFADAQTKTGSLADVSFMKGCWLGTFHGGPIKAA